MEIETEKNRRFACWKGTITFALVGLLVVVVVAKVSFSFGSEINYFAASHQRQLRLDPRSVHVKIDAADLRFAAFGTSRTWGTSLDDRETQPYVKQLSSKSVNFGIPAGKEDVPAMCLSTMMGDEAIFDVIILEFDSFHYYEQLVKRIRARFPHATIIGLEIQALNALRYVPDEIFIGEFMQRHGFKLLSDPAFHQYLMEHTSASDWSTHYPSRPFVPDKRDRAHREYELRKRILEENNAWFIQVMDYYHDIRESIVQNSKFFATDGCHPNAYGHQVIAQRLRNFLSERNHFPATNPKNIVGPWIGGRDQCVSWYEDGGVMKDVVATNMQLTSWMDGHKHALEVGESGGTLDFDSQIDGGEVHIAMMTMGPDVGHYPKVSVVIVPIGGDDGETNNDPIIVDPFDPMPNHVVRISPIVGQAHRGKNRLKITPLDQNTEHPFRITGIMVTGSAEDVQSSQRL